MAANAAAANGVNKVWECYVAGISPTNKTQVFRAVISWKDGNPEISWEPKLAADEEAKRVYTEIGKTNLAYNFNCSQIFIVHKCHQCKYKSPRLRVSARGNLNFHLRLVNNDD